MQSAVLLRESPLWSGGPGILQLKDRPPEDIPQIEQPHEMNLIEPGMKNIKAPRSWLERWWSPDPRKAPELRKAPRGGVPGLAAYYWTGASPKAHTIKDISSTGLYVVTEERWYPGTLILMTLQETDGQERTGHSIAVHSRAVRWGNDGVGLQFIPHNTSAGQTGPNPVVAGADQRELDEFLSQLRKVKG